MITKPCPDCGEPIHDLARRHKCGWSAHINDQRPPDPEGWRCVHEDRGQRCAKVGVVSPSVKHKTAPRYFCWDHVPAMQQMKDGKACPPPEGFFAAWRKKLGPRPVDFEAELERIALREEA